MESLLLLARSFYISIKTTIATLSELNADYDALFKRIEARAPLPHSKPTRSYWLRKPPFPYLVNMQSDILPLESEIVIIGSGITGAAIARTILTQSDIKVKVIMLEARDVCSGATGRNGGHIKSSHYQEYCQLAARFGAHIAADIIQFRMKHLTLLTELSATENIMLAECRKVETLDIFFDSSKFEEASRNVESFRTAMPDIGSDIEIWEAAKAKQKFKLGDHVKGVISFTAGALWPYRLVTAIIDSLLQCHPCFSLETNTPVTSISLQPSSAFPYLISTPRGTIAAKHVIHATNAHANHLIPGLKGKLFAIRGQMSAQVPGRAFPSIDGQQSWSFVYEKGFDYVTQRPGANGDIMLGGGVAQAGHNGLDDIGIWTDDETNHLVDAHLGGVLPMVFGTHWGAESEGSRIKDMWTGSIAFTADALPFVGKLPATLTQRSVSKVMKINLSQSGHTHKTEHDAHEWIAAGYNGEGMVHAWLCGAAVALMVLRKDNVWLPTQCGLPGGKMTDWLPSAFLVSERRVRRANLNDLAEYL